VLLSGEFLRSPMARTAVVGAHPPLLHVGRALAKLAAIDHNQHLHADNLRVFGADRPDTLATRHHLAHWRGTAGDPAGAVGLTSSCCPTSCRCSAPDHPNALATRHSLARWQGEAGDPDGAAMAFERLLVDKRSGAWPGPPGYPGHPPKPHPIAGRRAGGYGWACYRVRATAGRRIRGVRPGSPGRCDHPTQLRLVEERGSGHKEREPTRRRCLTPSCCPAKEADSYGQPESDTVLRGVRLTSTDAR
jgi:hypothetical protein